MSKSPSITSVSLEALIPYARNSRTHSDEQVAQIAASIKEFGWTNPVLIDADHGIIAGHGRVMAARKLSLDKVPCIVLSHLSDAQKKALIIADNKLALNAGWDTEMLSVEIDELRDLNFDINLLGFEQQELNDLIGTPNLPPEPSGEKDLNYTIQYNIVFDEEEQQEDWYGFVRFLKESLPDAETLGQRLQIFIRNNGYVAD